MCEFIIQEAENFIGCAMTYSLFESIKEKHFELIGTQDTNINTEQEVSNYYKVISIILKI